MRGQRELFDVDDRLKRLSDFGDQLETFRAAVDFELFRAELTAALAYSDGSEGGRPPFDPVVMFKIFLLSRRPTISLTNAPSSSSMTGCRSCSSWDWGLPTVSQMPTIWLFREKLTKAVAIKTLFQRFDATLRQAGFIAMSGRSLMPA